MTHIPQTTDARDMSGPSDGTLDAVIELLAKFDSQLADGEGDVAAAPFDTDLSSGAAELLETGRTCLRLLHAARQRGAWPGGPHRTPQRDGSQDTSGGVGDTQIDALWPRFDVPIAGAASARPKKLDRFEIIGELGQGGYGIIYRAIDPRLDRVVALKVPRPEIVASGELRLRVWREARAAAGLTHPNIAGIYEVGQLGPVCWIAQEYCRGPSLDEWLTQFRCAGSAVEAAKFVEALAEGVEHAHGRGVLHRDLKPGNVVLAPVGMPASQRWDAGDGGRSLAGYVPKLTDFGLAKIAERSDSATSVGIVIGTPRYMAPEQIEGKEEVGRATDVYGLGTILYEIWTGAPVFVGGTQVESFRQVLMSEPIAPSRMRADTPRDFEAILLRCLEKSPANRYPTAAALAEDLRKFQAGLPTAARPLSSPRRAARWARREPSWAALAAVAVLGPLILLMIALYHTHRLDLALSEAEAKRQLAERRESDLFRQSYPPEIRRAIESYRVAELSDARRALGRFRPAEGEEDLRGFEWGHLAHLCDPPCRELVGHEEAIYSVAISPDGKTIASGSKDHTVRLWSWDTGKVVAVLRGHEGEVNGVAFSPDGKHVASSSDDRTVRIWNVSSQQQLRRLTDCRRAAINVAYTPDGRYLLASCADPAVQVWDAAGEKLIKSMTGHQGHIDSLAVSSDGKFAITGCDDRTIREWDLEKLEQRRVIPGRAAGFAQGVAISPVGDRIAAGGADGMVRLWPLAGRRGRWNEMRHRQQVETVAFSPDGRMLASAGHDGQILLWDVASGASPGTIHGHSKRVWCVTFTPDGRHLLSAGADNVARIWELRRAASRDFAPVTADLSQPFAAASSGRFVAIQKPNAPQVVCWDVVERRVAQSIDLATIGRATALAVSPDEKSLAAAAQDRTVRIIELAGGREIARLDGLPSPAAAIVYSKDGSVLAARTNTFDDASGKRVNSAAVVWDVSDGTRRFSMSAPHLRCVALSPDGSRLATVTTAPANIELWNIVSAERHGELKGHRYDVHDLAFAPDNDTLASVAADATIRLWSFERRVAQLVLPHAARREVNLAFGPRGRTLAVAGPRDVEWLHVATGQRMGTFRATMGRALIADIDFAPDGSALFALSVAPNGHGMVCRFDAKNADPQTPATP